MIRILFLIRSLDRGGAERQLLTLVKGLDKRRFAVTVATYYDGGGLWPEIEGVEGVEVLSLHKKGRWDVLGFLWRLTRMILEVKPQIVHGYMSMSNLLGLLFGRILNARVVWGLRASNMLISSDNRIDKWSFHTNAWLSRFADLIIVNSYAGKQHYLEQGYNGERMVVIQNGIDTNRFRRIDKAGQKIRHEWNIRDDEQLIGLVGRIDPMKDHPTFLRAAALLAPIRNNVRFVCIGDGPAWYKQELQKLAEELGIGQNVVWVGGRSDMPAVYSALNIAVSASAYGEGFSNAIGESIACEVLCVATDVGDSAMIVGCSKQIVPPADPQALAMSVARILDFRNEQRTALAKIGRQRMVCEYSLQRLVRETESTLMSLL